ncbi:hypothetical protein RhiirA5_424433 [Rhizophagus irregularis]|uniref:Uncharacterized protein n=1 Tax=Rhizophagus irregularis TaxID=588596 RepID=A0A2N0P841_9GLOM|nr:hypothetical protein RhiirA5_424433 [Rhizophagus irregularis]
MKEYNIIVNVIDDLPSQTLKFVRLNLEDNLLKICQELEKKEVIGNSWLFSKKYSENNDTGYGFAEIAFNQEEFFLLNEIIEKNNYGCTITFDEIKRARSRAFEMKNHEFTAIGSEGYRKSFIKILL